MKKIARLVSFCLLLILSTEAFAKSVDPIRHAAGSAEARLAMDAFSNRILSKFSGLSQSHQESVLYGMYRLGVKAQNKLQTMDAQKIAARVNAKQVSLTEDAPALTNEEATASEFVSEGIAAESTAQTTLDASQISDFLAASAKALSSVGTPVDAKGNFKRLGRSDFMKAVREQLTGDGDYSGLADALRAFLIGTFVLLVLAAVVIVGLATVAFGLPGALASAAVIGLIVIIVLNG